MNFFQDEVPSILVKQVVLNVPFPDVSEEYEILCDRYGLLGRKRQTLEQCQSKYNVGSTTKI